MSTIGNIIKLLVVVAIGYAIYKYGFGGQESDDISEYATQACHRDIAARFDADSVSVYGVEKTSSGYVVRASAKLPRGTQVKVYCLTNDHGGVEDIRVEER